MADEVKFNTGFNGCNDRLAIVKNETVPRRLDEFTEIESGAATTVDDYLYVDGNGLDKKIKVSTLLNPKRTKSDWAEEREDEDSFILNKPGVNNLETDMVSSYNVGGIRAGHVFEKGTTVREIIDMLLSLNADGYFLAQITESNPSGLTEEELIEIDKDNKNHIAITPDILSNGYFWTINTDNDYFYIAIKSTEDTRIKVEKIKQAGFDIELKYQRVGSYRVWYFDKPSKGKFILRVVFKNEG